MPDVKENPGVGGMLGAAGPCPEIPLGRRVWKVGHPTQAAKARLEKLAAKVALDEVRRLKDVLDPAAYREAFDAVTQNLKSYRTWRPGWQAVVFDGANGHLFLWSLLQEHHPAATEADVLALCREAPEEVAAALAQVIPDFFGVLLGEVRADLSPEDLAKVDEALTAVRERLTPTRANTST